MLEEYKAGSIWGDDVDAISIRSDILVSLRAVEMLGDVKGKKILDAGCGNGKVSRMLEKKGAIVWGVDAVQNQIAIGQKKPSKIQYRTGDISNLEHIDIPRDFDVVISLMTFLYLDEQGFKRALAQFKGHLQRNGRLIWANIHPSRYPTGTKVTDELPTLQGKTFKTTFWNHSLDFIKQAFSEAGFAIDAIAEPLATADEKEKYPALLSGSTNTSPYLIISASLR